MTKEYDVLLEQAETIRTEVEDGANSAERVGGMFKDILGYTNIEDAVFPLSVQVSGGGLFEKGTTQSIKVSWQVLKGDSQVQADKVWVNNESVTGNSKQFAGVKDTTVYTVRALFGEKEVEGITTATFVLPMYFGFAEAGSLNISSLVKQPVTTTPSGTYNLTNTTTGHYLWLCVPDGMVIGKVTSSGFEVPMMEAVPGSTTLGGYKCYRSANAIVAGSYQFTLS